MGGGVKRGGFGMMVCCPDYFSFLDWQAEQLGFEHSSSYESSFLRMKFSLNAVISASVFSEMLFWFQLRTI